ncbi:TonB-dependent receptor [Pedobacter caeni]|uniref:TonB-dependent receptor n=1 Tax=Pedobacter caeni TaxID=288992 RepID=UPI001F28B8BA|nr:TonB-dependent receptor [Pedobacter caeni]
MQGQKLNKSSIKGQVSDEQQQRISFATIRLLPGNKTVATDQQGNYQFLDLPSGSYTIQISVVGFKKVEQKIVLKESEALSLSFSLKGSQNELKDVAISGKTKATKIKESGYAVNVIETKQYANTNSDINQVLSRSTGVKIREQGGLGSDYTFSINGLSGNHVKFFIDGIPLESYGSGMSFNNIPINIAERIEVYKGVVPPYLGSDALGGAVNIVTNRDRGKSLDVSYSYGSFNTHRTAVSGSYTYPKSGLKVNVNSFYNYSDNSYKMRTYPKANVYLKIPTPDGTDFETLSSAKRFHNDYQSYMGQVELGLADKKWADIAVLGLTYNNVKNERQTGATQEKVYGNVDANSHSVIPSFRYRKNRIFVDGLSATVFANMSISKEVRTDTSSYSSYQWNGKPKEYFPTKGEMGDKSILHYNSNNALVQLNLNYQLSDQHLFNLNYNLNSTTREGYNEIDPYNKTYNKTNRVSKTVVGLNYQQNFFNNKLTNSFFGKYFGFSGRPDANKPTETAAYYGYGLASTYKITEELGIKASYEHAYRLPGLVELYGNGLDVSGNHDLKPENSDNYNLGFFFGKTIGKHRFSADGSVFYRNAKNYIISRPYTNIDGGAYSESQNEGGIKIKGADFELKYTYGDLLSALVNMSYYDAVDREKLEKGTIREKISYGSRTPNEPWLYGNTDVSLGKNNVFGVKGNRLQFNWYMQFVNDYSLSWSKLGDKTTKDYIPAQWIQNIALTYSLKNGRYNITGEARNLTDQIAYDVFKQQKPGRAFFIKLRYNIHSF